MRSESKQIKIGDRISSSDPMLDGRTIGGIVYADRMSIEVPQNQQVTRPSTILRTNKVVAK